MTTELARAGGVVGALGLALLILGPSRPWRLIGLVAWAAGCTALAAWLAPAGHHVVYAGAAVVGAIGAVLLAVLLLRWPWLLAVLVLACAPARIPVSVGSTDANLLVPLYFVVVAAALALAWRLYWGDGPVRELARSRGRSGCSSRGSGCRCSGRRTSARARSRCCSSCSRSG